MQIDFHSNGLALTRTLRGYAERRLCFALVHSVDRVRRVAIHLFEVYGPRGATDKCCRIEVTLSGLAAVVVEDTEANRCLAIDRAIDRAGRTVMRRLAHHGVLPFDKPVRLASLKDRKKALIDATERDK